jgi:hypothetical protein
VPVGSKDTPFDYSEYVQQRIATPEELRDWFAGAGQFGLAAVLGAVGGLECLDLTYALEDKLKDPHDSSGKRKVALAVFTPDSVKLQVLPDEH